MLLLKHAMFNSHMTRSELFIGQASVSDDVVYWKKMNIFKVLNEMPTILLFLLC